MKPKILLAIFASGNGSNAAKIMDHLQTTDFSNPEFLTKPEVKVIISDKNNANVINEARKRNIPTEIIPFENSKTKSLEDNRIEHEKKIILVLKKYNIQWIILAGYMRVLSKFFLSYYWDPKLKIYNVINIHPSLLPAFPGINAYEKAFEKGITRSGITIHLVDTGIDTGPILEQVSFDRNLEDNLEKFKNRGLEIEHQIYTKVILNLAKGKQKLDNAYLSF